MCKVKMTNEEAISILTKMMPQPRGFDLKSMTHTKMVVALAKAIAALKQEPKWIPVNDPLKELPKNRMLLVTVESKYSYRYVTELCYDMTEWSDIDVAEQAIAYLDFKYPEPYKEE